MSLDHIIEVTRAGHRITNVEAVDGDQRIPLAVSNFEYAHAAGGDFGTVKLSFASHRIKFLEESP